MSRQRKGVLAVDKVDRLEEPKDRKHVDALVRQGPLQGFLTFLGLLVPLTAIYSVAYPSTKEGADHTQTREKVVICTDTLK